MSTKVFINLPVRDLAKSTAFYEAFGFQRNPEYSDETAACIVISDTIYVMLLTHQKFAQFTPKTIVDASKATEVLTAISVDSREEVDEFFHKAIAAGGSDVRGPEDLGFMYGRAFNDPDGHIWEIFWMKEA